MDSPYIGAIFIWAGNYAPQGYLFCDGSTLQIQQNQALFAVLGTTYGGDGVKTFNLPDLRGRLPLGAGQGPNLPLPQIPGAKGGNSSVTLAVNNLPPHNHAASFAPSTTGTQAINIPAVSGAGAITASASIAVTPGINGVQPANGTNNYYLTGTKVGSTPIGGFTTTAPSTGNTAGATGVTVSVDSSTYKPAIPAQTVNINIVTGGTVTIGNTGAGVPVDIRPPFLALNFIIATQGLFPPRD